MRILYLDLDTLNPTHLGCYGYHRNTSPTIDKIVAEGIFLIRLTQLMHRVCRPGLRFIRGSLAFILGLLATVARRLSDEIMGPIVGLEIDWQKSLVTNTAIHKKGAGHANPRANRFLSRARISGH